MRFVRPGVLLALPRTHQVAGNATRCEGSHSHPCPESTSRIIAMKALVKYATGPGKLRVQEVAEPALLPGHAVIQVKATVICGTDLHIEAGEYPVDAPVILGHEFSGVVADVGQAVSRDWLGQRVTAIVYFKTCGECRFCSTGRWNLCPQRKSVGSGVDGAFAQSYCSPPGISGAYRSTLTSG